MVNHVRTLLANLASYGVIGAGAPVGEEYIDPAFVPLDLEKDSVQAMVQRALFGSRPDRWMSNYRVHQLLNIIAHSSLESRVLDLDTRISYVVPSPAVVEFYCLPTRSGLRESTYRAQVMRNAGNRDVVILPVDQYLCPDASGQIYYEGILSSDGAGTAVLTGISSGRPDLRWSLVLDASGQWYQPVEVRDLGIALQIPAAGPLSWNIRLWRTPCWTVNDLWNNVDRLPEEGKRQVLYGVPYQELFPPQMASAMRSLWSQYLDVWQHADQVIDRLSAFLLSVVLCRHAMLYGKRQPV